jgi:hypothetical protein
VSLFMFACDTGWPLVIDPLYGPVVSIVVRKC